MRLLQCKSVAISAGFFAAFADSLLRYSLATTIQVFSWNVARTLL